MSAVVITSKKKRVEAASSAPVAASSSTVAAQQLACERHDAQKLACERHDAQKLINVLRGSFPKGMHESDFLGSEEEVGERNAAFLAVWLVETEHTSKDKERKAFIAAFPGMSQGSVDTAINKCRAVRKYVLRKGRNMKNGALTAVWVKDLLGCLQGVKKPTLPVQQRFSKKGSASSSGTDKPASQEVVAALPAEGKDGSNALPEKAKDMPLEEEMSSSEIDLAFLSQASIVSVGSSVSEPVVPLAGQKDPEAKMKRPAGKNPKKRPSILKVKQPGSAWKKSASFGHLKATKAFSKSYIQAKADAASKMYLLVNVQEGVGFSHEKIVDQLMNFATGAGLSKAMVVAERDRLKGVDVD